MLFRIFKNIIIILTAVFVFTFNLQVYADILEDQENYIIKDDTIGHAHKPYAKIECTWPEHKSGKITLKTNNLGFRADVDTKITAAKGVKRILITGDSHIDGAVNNNEGFAYLLERRLNSSSRTAQFEILNGGVSYYGPDHYFMLLHKYLFLKPSVYIVVIYTGNDFLDTARVIEAKDGVNKRPKRYKDALLNCKGNDAAISQVMNQIFYFKAFPEMKEKTVKRTLELILKIRDYCKINKIDFIVILLPTKTDVEWLSDKDITEKTKNCLDLNDLNLNINRELTMTLIQGIFKNKINFIDLYKDMKGQNAEFYWKKDYHLNVEGHKFLADKVYEKYYNFFN